MPIAADVTLGPNVRIFHPGLVNLYGCVVGAETKIGAFVEIQKNASVGARALIGAGAVVTRDVAEDAIVAGVPARLLRSGRQSREDRA